MGYRPKRDGSLQNDLDKNIMRYTENRATICCYPGWVAEKTKLTAQMHSAHSMQTPDAIRGIEHSGQEGGLDLERI